MQTTGEQNYWKPPQPDEEKPEQQASQYAGYDMGDRAPAEHQSHPDYTPISWEASEYIHSEKSASWFIVLAAVTLTLAAIAQFVVKLWTFTLLVFVMAVALGVYARRPPRSLRYTINGQGIAIEDRMYHYAEFRAFAIVEEGPIHYIMLLPIKRFMPAVSLYFPPENGQQIVDMLSSVLAVEQREPDFLDRTIRKLGF